MATAPIRTCPIPDAALLCKYAADGYADCYVAQVPGAVSHAQFVEAFYTTALFKAERLLLALFASSPSTDEQARQLAGSAREAFAAWKVEGRGADQLLLADMTGRTRSWLMVARAGDAAALATSLYFGSAVVPVVDRKTGKTSQGWMFHALLGFHKLYSRALLRAACARLARSRLASR